MFSHAREIELVLGGSPCQGFRAFSRARAIQLHFGLGFRFRFRLLLHHAGCYCQGTDDSGNEGADGVNDNAPVFFV